jgi:hypothetical protein
MQGPGMLRLGGEHAPIAGLGLRQSSGLMVVEARLQERGRVYRFGIHRWHSQSAKHQTSHTLLREFIHAVCKIQNPAVVSPIRSRRTSDILGRMSSEVAERHIVETRQPGARVLTRRRKRGPNGGRTCPQSRGIVANT